MLNSYPLTTSFIHFLYILELQQVKNYDDTNSPA